MTPADFTLAPLPRGRRARVPFVRAPRQASQVRVGRATSQRGRPGGGCRMGRACSMTRPRRFLGIWLEVARHLLTTPGGPSVVGSLSERRSARTPPTYAANIARRPAFNPARRDSPRAPARSRALGSTGRGTSPVQPGPGANHAGSRKRDPALFNSGLGERSPRPLRFSPTFPRPSTLGEHDARVDSVRAESAGGVKERASRGFWTAFALSLLARGESFGSGLVQTHYRVVR
jgi:hypothetical protein